MSNDVEIGTRTQLSTEVREWQIDLQPAEENDDSIGTVTATLTDLLTGAAYPDGLYGAVAASPSSSIIKQTVQDLEPGHSYRLVLSAHVGGSRITAVSLILCCPY